MNLIAHAILASFWTSDGILRISRFVDDHRVVIQTVLIFAALALVPASWNRWSNRFEKRHQRFLWILIVVMLLLIPVVAYWMFHL